jgi:eukaryotic-like serine/threonine-protein kinase
MGLEGKTLQGRYLIERQVGQGGMGAVYIASDQRFNSTVAIKQTLCMTDNYRMAIEREARLLNSLKHNALPRVIDHFVENNGQFLVMEYIPGEDLNFILGGNRHPFSGG